MHCPKCGGFMTNERLTDYSLVFFAWRCINCGTIVDNTIMKNKKSPSIMGGVLNSLKI